VVLAQEAQHFVAELLRHGFLLVSRFTAYKESLSLPILKGKTHHRFATPKAVKAGRQEERMIKDFHQILTNVLGGEYWKDILWQEIDAEERERQLVISAKG